MTDVDTAKTPGVFSLDKFLSDTAYPEQDVTLFTDARAMGELVKLTEERMAVEAKIAELNKAKPKGPRTVGGDSDVSAAAKRELEEKLAAIEAASVEYDDKVGQSALTFSLRGMAPYVVEEVTKKHFTDPKKDYSGELEEEARDEELIARSIVTVKNAAGEVDNHIFTPEDVKLIRGRLIGGEYLRLVQAVAQVNLNAALFDQAADASFLGRRTHVAG